MPNNIYTAGLRNVGSYQVSGHPYTTGSNGALSDGTEVKIQFPYVTKNVTVFATGSISAASKLRVHFNAAASGHVTSAAAHHYITLGYTTDGADDDVGLYGNRFTFGVRCKEIYLTSVGGGGFEVYAELTGIHTGSMYDVTGSGLTQLGPES